MAETASVGSSAFRAQGAAARATCSGRSPVGAVLEPGPSEALGRAGCWRWPCGRVAAWRALPAADLATVWTRSRRSAPLPAVAGRWPRWPRVGVAVRTPMQARGSTTRPARCAPPGSAPLLHRTPSPARCGPWSPVRCAKGQVSARLTALLEPPYLRVRRPCGATRRPRDRRSAWPSIRAGLELHAARRRPCCSQFTGLVPLLQVPAPDDSSSAYAAARWVRPRPTTSPPTSSRRSRSAVALADGRCGGPCGVTRRARCSRPDRHRLVQEPAGGRAPVGRPVRPLGAAPSPPPARSDRCAVAVVQGPVRRVLVRPGARPARREVVGT